MADLQAALSHYRGVKELSPGIKYEAYSPTRSEKERSVKIKYEARDDKILIHDFGDPGAKGHEIHRAAGGSMEEIMPEKKLEAWERNLEAEYKYHDASGRYCFSKLRYEGKKIQYARTEGKYQKGRGDNVQILYRLPELVEAIKHNKTVYVTEGEKDADNLVKRGLVATTPGGVGDWKPEFADYFIGADVVLLPDSDEPGRDLMRRIDHDLAPVAFKRRTIITSEVEKGDISDWFNDGHSKGDLLSLVNDTEPNYPTWYVKDGNKRKINAGLLSEEILNRNRFIVARNLGTNSDVVYVYDGGVYLPQSDGELIARIMPYLPVAISNPTTLSNVGKMIRYGADPHLFDEVNQQEKYINLSNGLYNIQSHDLREHAPDLLTTTQLSCSYDPKAKAPAWESFVYDLCMDDDGNADEQMRLVIQEWAGLLISPIHGYRVKMSLVLFSSVGNTGKSVFLMVMSRLLGIRNVANVSFQELGSSRWATGRAYGKRLLAIGDQGAEAIDSSSTFKQLTGGDLVSAEFKGLQGFDYKFTGVVVAACNSLPVFNDDKGNHMADRLQFIHCRNVVPKNKRDPVLADKLMEEADGIFLWALEGLQRLIKNNYQFTQCDSSDRLMAEYRKRYDTLYAFLTDQCIVTGESLDHIRKTEFENAYLDYCSDQDFTPLSRRNIAPRAAGLGVRLGTAQGISVYRGVKFKDINDSQVEGVPF